MRQRQADRASRRGAPAVPIAAGLLHPFGRRRAGARRGRWGEDGPHGGRQRQRWEGGASQRLDRFVVGLAVCRRGSGGGRGVHRPADSVRAD